MRGFVCLMVFAAALAVIGCDEVKVSDEDVVVLREQVVAEVANDPSVAIVDVRKPEAYRAGHLPNAINIYLPEIVSGDPRLANAKRIIVYAGGWTDPLSTAAVKRMMSLGYTNVQEFKGGVEVWKDAGYNLVVTPATAAPRPETGQ